MLGSLRPRRFWRKFGSVVVCAYEWGGFRMIATILCADMYKNPNRSYPRIRMLMSELNRRALRNDRRRTNTCVGQWLVSIPSAEALARPRLELIMGARASRSTMVSKRVGAMRSSSVFALVTVA